MDYIKPKAGDIYLSDVSIENIFINEYMPDADGDYVKVYLLARLYAEIGRPLSTADMARELGISEKVVGDAWDYWEDIGAITKRFTERPGKPGFSVEFVNLKEM
ncbi:MAG: primosomal replication protein N, partial [Eubacterium sp.]|nr:primosomal replication protein N [Eubacterium sp.]